MYEFHIYIVVYSIATILDVIFSRKIIDNTFSLVAGWKVQIYIKQKCHNINEILSTTYWNEDPTHQICIYFVVCSAQPRISKTLKVCKEKLIERLVHWRVTRLNQDGVDVRYWDSSCACDFSDTSLHKTTGEDLLRQANVRTSLRLSNLNTYQTNVLSLSFERT